MMTISAILFLQHAVIAMICFGVAVITLILLSFCISGFFKEDFFKTIDVAHEVHTLDLTATNQVRKRVSRYMAPERVYDMGGRRDICPTTVVIEKAVLTMAATSPEETSRQEEVIKEQGFEDAWRRLPLGFPPRRWQPNMGKTRTENDGSYASGL